MTHTKKTLFIFFSCCSLIGNEPYPKFIYLFARVKPTPEQELNDAFFQTGGGHVFKEEVFKRTGYILKTPESYTNHHLDDPNVKYIISYNTCYKYNLKKYPKEKLILFLLEAPTVLPDIYKKEYFDLFSKVFTWDDDLIDNKKFFKLIRPVSAGKMTPNIIPFEQKKLCIIVCTNKPRLGDPRELFSERKNVIDFFENIHTNDFEFYGRFWDKTQYKNYKGILGPTKTDKINCIKNYKFYICYENMSDIKGYITEKIFDCFRAGTVPIYWGASNIEDYIPQNCFIDRRNFKNTKELYEFIKKIDETIYKKYLANIREFLSSDQAKKLGHGAFIEHFIYGIMA